MYIFYLFVLHLTVCNTIKCFWILLFCAQRNFLIPTWASGKASVCVCVCLEERYENMWAVCAEICITWSVLTANSPVWMVAVKTKPRAVQHIMQRWSSLTVRFVLFVDSTDWAGPLLRFLRYNPRSQSFHYRQPCCLFSKRSWLQVSGKNILPHAKKTKSYLLYLLLQKASTSPQWIVLFWLELVLPGFIRLLVLLCMRSKI